ncbi:uncharacterized protein LOC122502349 isoform X1 [Leptopilina heterotoma]|uniref:uncharacterized protein LOC122502349 isoform X1 n=2 Tax=Leptopilina heterotoma TaxID=63436 RepID=UPI001CA7B972|nr:uncharacterized protein LOC122502349 isoform X1 [Leptopilina heterotoma]
MYIKTNKPGFKGSNFFISTFYGEKKCFVWKGNELIVFAYNEDNEPDSTLPLSVITVPGEIKDIQNFDDRVFMICKPCGIYKLTEKLQFANLSRSGIGLGCEFSNVFSFSDRCVHLEDKQIKTVTKLFQVPTDSITSNEFSSVKLKTNETDVSFRTAFLEDNEEGDICLIAYNKFLYKLTKNVIILIYNCDYTITGIVPMEKNGFTSGIALLTVSTAVIFIYFEEEELKYDKIYLNYDSSRIIAFSAKFEDDSDHILFIYSTKSKTYQCRKKLSFKSVQTIHEDDRVYVALKFYCKSNFALGLTSFNELCRIRLRKAFESISEQDNDFVDMKLDMMQGTEIIVDKICEKAKELQHLNDMLQEKKDILKRINMFAYEKHEKYCPMMNIKKLSNKTYLEARFRDVLPVNSQVVLAANCGDRTTFCIKNVISSETQINLPLTSVLKTVDVNVELITYNPKEEAVCLIKDFIKDPDRTDQGNLSPQKENFIKLKIRALENLINEGKFTMELLSEMKNNIRAEMQNTH